MAEASPTPRTTIFREMGLVGVFLITLVYVGVVLLTPGSPAQIPLGFFELVFAPGYVLGALLFARRPILPPVAEFPVVVGLSIVFNVLVGLLLAITAVGLRIDWLVSADAAVVWAGVVVLAYLGDAPGVSGVGRAFQRELRLPGIRPSYRPAVYALLIACLLAFAGTIYLGVSVPTSTTPSSLALYGPDGTTGSLPIEQNLSIGVIGLVLVSIVDGQKTGSLTLVVESVNNKLNTSTSPTAINWTQPMVFYNATTSSLALGLTYGQQTTLDFTFEYSYTGTYSLKFALESSGASSLPSATLGVRVVT